MTTPDITVALPKGKALSVISPVEASYPYKKDQKFITVNVAGKCNLKCPYCYIGKRIPINIEKSDFTYIFDTFGENIHFTFGGVGDFFLWV